MPDDPQIQKLKEHASQTAQESVAQSSDKILGDIFYHSASYSGNTPTERTNHVIAHFSSLLVNLAKQSEESAKQTIKLTEETMKYTKRLHRLTVAIVILTVVLLFQGFFELPKIPIKFPQNTKQENQQANQNNLTSQPKPTVPTVLATR